MNAREQARAIVRNSAAAAGAAGGVAGALPVPFVDVAVATPIQILMINKISAVYHLPTVERQATFSVSLVAGAVAAQVGRQAAKAGTKAALKLVTQRAARFVPLVGPIVGGAVSGTVAVSTTLALGHAWIKVCDYAVANDLKKLDEFLESPEGKALLVFLAACGLTALIYTFLTTADHKVILDTVPTVSPTKAQALLDKKKQAMEVAQRMKEEFLRQRRKGGIGKILAAAFVGGIKVVVQGLGFAADGIDGALGEGAAEHLWHGLKEAFGMGAEEAAKALGDKVYEEVLEQLLGQDGTTA